MRTSLAIIVVATCLGSVSAQAESITDVDGWAKNFTEAAGKTDTEAMTALVRKVALNDELVQGIEKHNPEIQKFFGGHQVIYAEKFQDISLGDIRRRVDIAVQYTDTQNFYSLSFMKMAGGWQLYRYDYYSDINKILKLDW